MIAISPSTRDIKRRYSEKGRWSPEGLGYHVETCTCYSRGSEEGVAFEPESDTATAVFIFECGAFQRWETEGMGTSWETRSS